MGGYYINVSVRTSDAAAVCEAVTAIFVDAGFRLSSDAPAAMVLEDEDRLPPGEDWSGVIVSGVSGPGWVSVYLDDWQDSGYLAKRLSRSLAAPVLEAWVADDIHWGYTYYEDGTVRDRFADDPSQIAESAEEAALYRGRPDSLVPILQIPPAQFADVLDEASANVGQFASEPLDALARAIGVPFEHLFTGYEYFFTDDPEDYGPDLENWNAFRFLAYTPPPGRETLSE